MVLFIYNTFGMPPKNTKLFESVILQFSTVKCTTNTLKKKQKSLQKCVDFYVTIMYTIYIIRNK